MLQGYFCFDPLNLAQQQYPFIRRQQTRGRFAGVHKSERVPFAVRNELCGQSSFIFALQEFQHPLGNLGKARMLPHAPPPVFRVPEIRFAPVHNRVKQAAVRILDALRDAVCRIQMVVPEQDQRAHQIAVFRRKPEAGEDGCERGFQFALRTRARARTRAQFGWLDIRQECFQGFRCCRLRNHGAIIHFSGELVNRRPCARDLASRANYARIAGILAVTLRGMTEPEPLQQINRTYVRFRGRTLSYFGGCDYFRLASHPAVLAAVREGLVRYGLNVAASRLTSGEHEVYRKLEQQLARCFHSEAALLLGNGYITSSAVAQALAGHFSHALIDARAHVALQDATQFLGCPVLKFKHRDREDFERNLQRCGRGSRTIVLTDGMFGHDGSVAPLREYLKMLPRDSLLLVDDAHGAGTLGKTGGGTVELEGVSRTRVVQCATLSKAFGVYGGAVLVSRALRERIIARSHVFVGSTPLPLPLAHTASVALQLARSDRALRKRLTENVNYVREKLRASEYASPENPGPLVSFCFERSQTSQALQTALFASGILPPFIRYPGGPTKGYFRFAISSEHRRGQLDKLVAALAPFVQRASPPS